MTRWTRSALAVGLALGLIGCVPGGGGGGGSGGSGGGGGDAGDMDGGVDVDTGTPAARAPERLWPEPAGTLTHAAAIGALDRLAAAPGFDAAAMGDPAVYLAEEADTPSDPAVFASVYYQSGDLAEAFEAADDERPGIDDGEGAGSAIASRIARGIQLGAVSDGAPNDRSSARWHALQSARRLDAYALFAGWDGLAERSAAGYDRFLGLLWDADGAPQGTGARLAAVDALCGTDHLARIAETLDGVSADFAATLDELGQLDPFDRLVIEPGDSPAYDGAIVQVIEILADGLAVSLLATLNGELDTAVQAEALGALDVIAADLAAADPATLDMLGMTLDDADPKRIDADAVRGAVAGALGVAPCAP